MKKNKTFNKNNSKKKVNEFIFMIRNKKYKG